MSLCAPGWNCDGSIPINRRSFPQVVLKVLQLLEKCLLGNYRMDAITLQPAAGATGELTGLLLIRAHHEKNGNPRKKVFDSGLGA